MSTVDLLDADRSTGGGKAAPLAELARAGFDVPAGFVVPTGAYRAAVAGLGLDGLPPGGAEARSRILGSRLPDRFADDVARALARITAGAPTGAVAVRSSSTAEDDGAASAAGQHDSFLAVRGAEQVCRAVLGCWASLWTDRAAAYRTRREGAAGPAGPEMAVLVQAFVDPDVSGVMFTGGTGVIEASWGVGESVVGGRVTPDSWRLGDSGVIERRTGSKATRADRLGGRLVTRPVPPALRREPCLTDEQVEGLHRLGREVSAVLGGPRDIEWAIAGSTTWVLQARPVTAPAPAPPGPRAPVGGGALFGEPGSPGVASGPVRLVRGPADFSRVEPGDVLVCRHTDPAWTPLFTIASAVVTETGGVLSHAAIVARETGIPAVLAVPRATELLAPSAAVTVDGGTGRVSPREP